ncbi:hypothetical protein IWX91DRAFT_62353 [Phyllosticta citricarpa]
MFLFVFVMAILLSEQDSLSQSIDALVNEPDVQTSALPAAELSYLFNQPRRATPTVPPGLSAPTSRVGTPSSASIRPPPGIPTPIAPAVPDLPTSRVSTPSRTNKDSAERSKATDNIGLDASKTPTIEKPDTAKVIATKTNDTPTPRSESGTNAQKGERGLTDVSNNGKEAKNGKGTSSKVQSPANEALVMTAENEDSAGPKHGQVSLTGSKDEKQSAESYKIEQKAGISTAKRQHPGMLHIPKKDPVIQEREPSSAGTEGATKNPRAVSLTSISTSRPATPTGTAAGSPLKRTGPSIMRITNTPKMESPPTVSASAPVSAVPNLSVASIRSRQPSLASINQAPGTPLSEFISDAASMTSASASISRTNSPPPGGRVGSAPARIKTKSQAKKERQEKAKQMAEQEIGMTMESRAPSEEPIVQEGIQTRKRKEKKEKKKSMKTTKSTPTDTPTGTPVPDEGDQSSVVETISQDVERPKEEVEERRAPQPLTASQIVAKLLSTGEITHEQIENMFKSFPQGPNERHVTLQDAPNRGREYELSEECARAVFEDSEAQRLGGEDGRISSRVLISGSGRIIRCLSKSEEDRYLQVESRLRSAEPPNKWTPTKEPVFDIEAIMRDLCVQDVLERQFFSRRQQRPGSSAAASAAGAADSTAAQLALDEAANYNDEFIVPSDPADSSTSSIADDALPVKKARHAVETQKQHAAARLASTPRGAASGLPSFPYVTLNGISLTDNAGLLLGIDFGNGSGTNYNHSTASVGVGVGKGRNAAGGASAVLPSSSSSAAAAAASPAYAGPMPSLQMVEKELNAEKQRANEATKRLNQAAKRVRKIVQTGSGWGGAASPSASSPSVSTK